MLQILARDRDEGDNKNVRYELSSTTDFKIGKKSGELFAKRNLSDQANREYRLTVTAKDLGQFNLHCIM